MWLLVAALPLQGWAAATMIHCGPGHHRVVGAAPQVHDHSHHHGAALAAQDVATSDVDGVDHNSLSDPHRLQKLGTDKCSACAACCTTAVLPATVLTFDPVALTDFVAPILPQAVAVFLTDGPERPPRTHLA
jgi:hypothetical protein